MYYQLESLYTKVSLFPTSIGSLFNLTSLSLIEYRTWEILPFDIISAMPFLKKVAKQPFCLFICAAIYRI